MTWPPCREDVTVVLCVQRNLEAFHCRFLGGTIMSSVIVLGKGRTHVLSKLSYVKAPLKNFTPVFMFRSCQTETCS